MNNNLNIDFSPYEIRNLGEKNSNDLASIAKSLFDISKAHKIELIDKKLTNLNDINSPINQNIKLNETRNYLERLIHDKEQRPYIENYTSLKLSEINKLDMTQRLEQYEYKKEQQLELELINKQKDYSYTY
jgi:hypothetical protein